MRNDDREDKIKFILKKTHSDYKNTKKRSIMPPLGLLSNVTSLVYLDTLSDEDRLNYANALNLNITNPAALTLKTEDLDIIMPTYELEIPKDVSLAGDSRAGGYCDTNVFEDFAEFYKGYNGLSQEAELDRHNMNLWNRPIPLTEWSQDEFERRLNVLDLARLLLR